MVVFKCKMCGGDLEISPNFSIGTCQYCGSKMTLPNNADDQKANLYNRANHFRRNHDFDKAASIYENILNTDGDEAEAYWGLVLCKYGIEYVEDPKTHQRIPTCHRTQYGSILADSDYKEAIAKADSSAKALYETEAKIIDDLQKDILAISEREAPFDVFICYKEQSDSGTRTKDSVLAQELYYELKEAGFRVFFSRITLEDKLGTAYEPYIFAALHSARVMVVVGTKPEYFSSVWVKNEWSRYLSFIQNGEDKVLIPAYRDMDPYDLPEEFAHLQAQDMGKLGFVQDLVRGIGKIMASTNEQKSKNREPLVQSTENSALPLIKRAYLCLEEQDFQKADELIEESLNRDPENAGAYIAKLMIKNRVSKQERLADLPAPFDQDVDYKRALRFADEGTRKMLEGYHQTILARLAKEAEEKRLREEQAAEVRAKNLYEKAKAGEEIGEYELAALTYRELGEYEDAPDRLMDCLKYIKEEKEQALALQKKKEARQRKIAILLIIALVILLVLGISACQFNRQVLQPSKLYKQGMSELAAGNELAARSCFMQLGDWKDAEAQATSL